MLRSLAFAVRIGWLFREPVRLHALLEKWTDGIDTIGADAPVIPPKAALPALAPHATR